MEDIEKENQKDKYKKLKILWAIIAIFLLFAFVFNALI